ncbi:lipopolysaccharide biosynthesis protein [Neobacillus notoginsengisoli]|uniref:Lipopolysaccharide biosynthesis protein n=1 Tax=Neobacillus notoginsengisoli TaxID=1578198 RepID=A0A417YGU8_9BACI|nr:oligosaccharide flippase family protein [Neobacillus notoginsengisoli]RHW32105.1 lipopolysaccharide biosynthesis protein [Neobacillus notoginsengisoli]
MSLFGGFTIKKRSLIILKNLRYKLNGFNKGSFIRNVFTVASGTAIAQLIGILFSPLITRIYGPEAFGILGVFASLTSIIGPVVALTYPMAIVLPRDDTEAKTLAAFSVYIGVSTSVLVSILLGLFGRDLLSLLNMDVLFPYLIIIPFYLLLSTFLQVTEQWIIRKKLFSIKAKVTIYHALILNIAKVGMGFYYPVATVLIVLTTVGQMLNTVLLSMNIKKELRNENKIKKKLPFRSLAKSYKDFPIYRAPEMLVNGVTQSLPMLMLTTFFGPASAGFYVIGNRLLSMPAQIIGKAVGDVFYPRIAEAVNNKEKASKLVLKATKLLALVGLIPFGFIILFGPAVFSFTFGTSWEIAGEYARWMALWTYFMFLNNPSVRVIPVISEQRFFLLFTNVSLVIRFGLLIVGAYFFNSDIMAIALFSISGAILNIILIFKVILKCKRFDKINLSF